MKFKRIYHPVELWEEVTFNMWGDCENEAAMLERAIKFTGNAKLYGSYMRRVVREWVYSCENALTDPHLNKRAWVGHAAAALAFRCPEDVTRKAWGYLTDEQRLLANTEASNAIGWWEKYKGKSFVLP